MDEPLISADKDDGIENTEVSPELRDLQQEWSDLLRKEELEVVVPPACNLSPNDKEVLAGLWFDDGTLGVTIDYPQSRFELFCYYLTRSRYNITMYTIVTIIQTCLPFCEPPGCPWTQAKGGEKIDMNYTDNGRYMSLQTSRIISLICIVLYSLDVGLRLIINNRRQGWGSKPGYKSKWVLFRLLCCVAMLTETTVFFINGNPFRFTRCLVPVLYITRRHSLRKMAHGLMISVSRTLNIQMLQVAVLVLWTFAGYILFHNVPLDSGSRFDTLPESFFTVLHAITSRSYNMLRLSDYYAHSTVTAVFFVGLTLAGDLVCTNLIIAVGNRQYRLFGIQTFRRQLQNRRQALIAIHEILSDERGYISRCTWLGFCSRINGKYAVKKNFADLLFNLECMQLSGSEPDDSAEDVIDCEGLFRLCALLSTRVRVIVPAIRTQATNSAGIVKDQSHDGAVEIGANEGGQVAPPQQPHTRRHSSVAQLVHHTGGDSSGSDTDEDVVEGEETADAIGEKLLTGPGGGDPQEGIKRKRSRSRSKGASRAYGESAIDAELTLQDYWDDLRDMGRCAVSYCFPVHAAVPYLRHWSATPGKDSSAVQKCLHWVSTVSICPWNIFFILVRGMLVAQLFLVSTSDRKEWVYLGWAIEGLFWLEMLVLICSIGWGKYLKRNGYGYVMTLNIGSLIVMILIGSSTRQDGYKYYSLLVIQMCRFFRFSRFLKGFKTFYAITPLILRMFFIIFAIIYIFADFAHNRMCNTLNPDNIHDEDDDSEQWLGYQHVLNFKTYLQSVLTLYEVATLGNWSPIMGAAAQTDPVLSLLFFYTYRLTMTLAVFPLLFAFIIQAFITRRDLDDQDKGKTSPSPDGVSSTCGATAERAKLSDSPSGHGCLKYRRQLYSNMLEFDNWTNGRDDQNTKRPAETRPVSSSDLSGSTAKSFSAHRFASMASGGHVNSLNPPDDSASFTDMTSPITTSRYRRRRPESFPARSPISPARSDGGGYKVEKEIDKGTSMMAFWAQGEKTTSDAQKDKNRVMMLQRMLDDTLEQLAMERKAHLAKEAAYQETLRKLTAKSEGLK